MINHLSDKVVAALIGTATLATSQALPDVGVVLNHDTTFSLREVCSGFVFIGGCVWWLASRLQRGDDTMKEQGKLIAEVKENLTGIKTQMVGIEILHKGRTEALTKSIDELKHDMDQRPCAVCDMEILMKLPKK